MDFELSFWANLFLLSGFLISAFNQCSSLINTVFIFASFLPSHSAISTDALKYCDNAIH